MERFYSAKMPACPAISNNCHPEQKSHVREKKDFKWFICPKLSMVMIQVSVRDKEGDHLSEIHLPPPTYPQCLGPRIIAPVTPSVLCLASSFHSRDKVNLLVPLVDLQGGVIKQGIKGTKGRK